MLTQQQRDTFRLALASLNCYSVEKVEDLDIDDMLTDEQVVETRDTVEDFFAANGRKLNRKGERPEVPYEQNQTLLGTNQTLSAELAQAKDENESLQLSLMEQEEKQGATAARIQALVERVSAGPVSA